MIKNKNYNRINNISKLLKVPQETITDFFETWKGFYDIDSKLSDIELASIIHQHL